MVTVYNVADFFIDLAQGNENDTITNMRVNKLVYFAQAWFLARYDIPLFSEEIEAWDYGPVIPALYQKYKTYGKNNIESVSDDYSPDIFSTEELETLKDVFIYYGKFSTTELVNRTHQKGGPWYMVTSVKNRNTNIITKESLRNYYQSQKPLDTFIIPNYLYKDLENTKRSENGTLVLSTDDWEEDDA